ncbi:MAG TPA: AraC family transcriptional regulator [Candidatus Eisenbergiella pullistercoris]|uniref:AraC family transcriptional regulator n=1 Tax=Candidatus Eisenbergiella pullistercoris TaxID=2838555 RepID=A0A9D1YUE9_9FIRM|nr:AraC family transcriptional regulator [Candidatus Eisenbergiella pullistercoris]
MAKSVSDRVLATPSAHARARYLYVQEIGTLTSMEPHISSRENLSSYLFLTVRRGEGYLTYRGKRHFIKTGDCVYINCRNQYAHESTAEHPWTLMWVHFNGNGADDFYQTYQEQERGSIFHPPDPAPFTDSLTALYSLMHEKPSLMELYAHRYLTDLITLCFTGGRPEAGQEDSVSPKLLSVRQYLEEHYMEKITLEELSSRFFISKYHLSREYKKHYGITIGNDLTARRLSHAKSLLRFSDGSIEGIAAACGFSDAGYFIKVFRRSEGMTPLEYRRKW